MTIKDNVIADTNDEENQQQAQQQVDAGFQLAEDEPQQSRFPQQEQLEEEEEITIPPETEYGNGTASNSTAPKRRPFPRAFLCPLTHKIMREPVVHPEDYLTYEKSAIIERDGDSLLYYPNRSLQAYIEQESSRWMTMMEGGDDSNNQNNNIDGSMRGTLKRLNDSARSGWQKLLDNTPLPMDYYRPLPDAFYCPITCDLIFDPAVDPDGTTYERSAIIQWLLVNGVSPNTRNPLRIEQLYENKTLLALLLEESEGDPETVHPSLKRWREELATRPPRPPDPEMPADSASADGDNNQQTTAPIPPSHLNPQYPTTQAEWEELRRRRRPMTFLAILATLLACAMFLFFPSYFIFFVFCACGLLWIRKTQIAEQQQMMHRERQQAHTRNYHQWQLQQQLQQNQQNQQPQA